MEGGSRLLSFGLLVQMLVLSLLSMAGTTPGELFLPSLALVFVQIANMLHPKSIQWKMACFK